MGKIVFFARRDPAISPRFVAITLLAAVAAFVAALWVLGMIRDDPVNPVAANDLHSIAALPSARDSYSASFHLCHSGGGTNCVVDGDTFWFAGEKYRIADIDTPETHPARCQREAQLGAAATNRLYALLNDGAFSLESIDRDTDRYGRKLRVVTRGGESVGEVLVNEGLARHYAGGRRPWC